MRRRGSSFSRSSLDLYAGTIALYPPVRTSMTGPVFVDTNMLKEHLYQILSRPYASRASSSLRSGILSVSDCAVSSRSNGSR